jgi:phosphotransferase system  glucose/maltose/N-acetylglucosamine-specific IIC component
VSVYDKIASAVLQAIKEIPEIQSGQNAADAFYTLRFCVVSAVIFVGITAVCILIRACYKEWAKIQIARIRGTVPSTAETFLMWVRWLVVVILLGLILWSM